MTHAVDIPRLRQVLASLQLWLCDLMLWLADALGQGPLGDALRDRVRSDLAATEDCVRAVLALMALQRIGMPPAGRRCGYGRADIWAPPRGFACRAERGDPLRKITKVLRLGGRCLAARAPRGSWALVFAHADRLCAVCCAPIAPRFDTS